MSLIPYQSDEELVRLVSEYDEYSFQDLPAQLRLALQSRDIMFRRREPTECERNETVSDAKEHRYMNNELTFQDYKDKYSGKHFKLY
tara:strand:- start:363 stop:623 length:261 start_codon:yes stop_codon:yes gene_type:complete